MTIQTLFDRMMLYDNGLDLVPNGDEVAKALTAINLVQDWFEAAAAEFPDVHQTYSTLATASGVEYTAWPDALLRLDNLWLLDANGRQVRKLDPISEVGGHTDSFLLNVVTAGVGSGAPQGYTGRGQGSRFMWDPLPDAVYTIRAYGLWACNDYEAASETFAYPDSVALVLVPHAVQIIRTGLDRDFSAQAQAAGNAFKLALKRKAVRVEADSKEYSDIHDT